VQYTKEHRPGYVKNPAVVGGGKKPGKRTPFRKPGQMNHEYTIADKEASLMRDAKGARRRESGVSAAAKNKMASALSGYMKNSGSRRNRTPQRMTQGTSGDAQVGIGKMQDARNLAAMMKRQRMGG
jgi:hypothetical protein